MDDELVSKYQYIFNCQQGIDVLEDLRQLSGIDEPLTADPLPDDRELIKRAVWRDVYSYIAAMADGRGD
jgi:hypothetical protein